MPIYYFEVDCERHPNGLAQGSIGVRFPYNWDFKLCFLLMSLVSDLTMEPYIFDVDKHLYLTLWR